VARWACAIALAWSIVVIGTAFVYRYLGWVPSVVMCPLTGAVALIVAGFILWPPPGGWPYE